MEQDEIRDAECRIRDTARLVMQYKEALPSKILSVYQPQGLTPAFLRVKKPYQRQVEGYFFAGGDPKHPRYIVEEQGDVFIATPYGRSGAQHDRYALHTIYDFVVVWVEDERFVPGNEARKRLLEVLYEMSQLLPEGHEERLDRSFVDGVRESVGSSLER